MALKPELNRSEPPPIRHPLAHPIPRSSSALRAFFVLSRYPVGKEGNRARWRIPELVAKGLELPDKGAAKPAPLTRKAGG